jgi:tRNA nucleotidyltransferase/poly(A) polymerase
MIINKSFKDFVKTKNEMFSETDNNKDWRKEFIQLEKGFIPPPKMRPLIDAFLNSAEIQIMDDTSKEVTMPKKTLFLCGGSVRDFLKGKSPQDFHLATNATPAQIALILHSAGFKLDGQKPNLKLTFTPKEAEESSKRLWLVKGKNSKNKPYSIGAVVNGEEFVIETLRKDPKTETADANDFVDNPIDDAATRDLTINALYIELSKSDGENSKLFDPTKQGWHDVNNELVRAVGKAEDRFKEDPSRVLRTVRFHSRFSKYADLDPDIKKAMERHKGLDGVEMTKIRDEFLKGLLHPDTDIKRYVKLYQNQGLMKKLFPDIEINMDIPPQFSQQRDKSLALAWLLQNNPIEKVADTLASSRAEKQTGWSDQERRAVLFLLFLKEFTPQDRPRFLKALKGTGLSKDQLKDWVEMFNITDSKGRVRNKRPLWAVHVKTFADHDNPLASFDDVAQFPDLLKPKALDDMEIEKFMKMLPVNNEDE